MSDLTAHDLRRLLDAAADLASVVTRARLRERAVEVLFDVMPATRAGWVTMDLSTGAMSGYHLPEPIPFVVPLMPRDLAEVPLVAELLAAPVPGSLRISDTITEAEWHSRRLWAEVYRPLGGEYQIGSLLTVDEGLVETLAVFRADSDFTDRELALAEEVARQVRVTLARLRASEAREARELLTSRQRQVLAALETGATIRQAAVDLGITEKTLENHLQTIYRRLGVSSRTAALHRTFG
ncbi:MAG TPA: LuxR C-terminal-related transcriptional regulator [Rhodoglobus sp.]|nr:LuxR C-terminal-related transcriptional regulator [Rhodoglobus sp.]